MRNNAQKGSSTSNNQVYAVDLLAPLHTEDALFRMAKVGGQFDSAPSAVGKTCVRILGQLQLFWTVQDPVTQFQPDDGAVVGIHQSTWLSNSVDGTTTVPADPAIDLLDPIGAANVTDWMLWNMITPMEEALVEDTSDVAGTGAVRIATWRFDCRSKRRLNEIGDSIVLAVRPWGDGTQNVMRIHVTTSTLLR